MAGLPQAAINAGVTGAPPGIPGLDGLGGLGGSSLQNDTTATSGTGEQRLGNFSGPNIVFGNQDQGISLWKMGIAAAAVLGFVFLRKRGK